MFKANDLNNDNKPNIKFQNYTVLGRNCRKYFLHWYQ